jgi:signal transduction histidine kinase/DNA-binding response OmpR family regulator
MAAQASADTWSFELEDRFAQLREETMRFSLAGLFILGVALLGSVARPFDPARTLLSAGALFALIGLVWLVRRWSYAAAAWLLVGGLVAALAWGTAWSGLAAVVCLLALPVGLATLLIGVPAGLALAAALSAGLLALPAGTVPLPGVSPELRAVALIGTWGALGMIWLTLNPLLRTVQWAWAGYERNRDLLERARDVQVQLHETLEDLTAANVQLTQLNRLTLALRQAAEDERQAKEQFVANVSHELRTPLNMIIGFCEMITQAPEAYRADGESARGGQAALPPALLADLQVVLRNSQHLSSLIDDVLDLSQIEAGQMALTRERVPMAEVVRSAVTAVRPLYASKNLTLETELPEDLPQVYCDRVRMREVMLNLLSNAGRFTERGGVRVRVRQEGGDVVVSVADTGPGIGREGRDRLFRPFEQLDGTIRRRYGGTGLGLSISRHFVELHEGRMWVESEEGQGTTFFFQLPIDPPAPLDKGFRRWFNPYERHEARARPSRLQAVAARPRVLVVEEGDSMRRLFSRYMDGYDVLPAAGLEDALGRLSRAPAQALLINDLDVARAVQRLDAAALPFGVPAVVCAIPGVEEATSGLEVADYLVKPISRPQLLAALDRLEGRVETVLIVDDEPDALQLFWRMLARADRPYRVLRAYDGRQALEVLRAEPVDAVLLDLAMPEMDGFQFLAARAQEPALRDIPVILISARDPLGHPIVSKTLAVTLADGLSARQIVECVEALSGILSISAPVAAKDGRLDTG